MKRITLFNILILGFVLIFAGAGCKKVPKGTTPILGQRNGVGSDKPGGIADGGIATPVITADTNGSIPFANGRPADWDTRTKNREMFANDTVYFDVDSASVKGSEKSKLDAVASGLKSQPGGDLLIEGHCDERGTEGYNLALGDRRANALREYLANLGVPADKIHTVSFGEAKPVATGTGEATWSKNRRGEFIFVEPAK